MKKIYFTFVLFVASLSTSFATNYFVDPVNGSDSNDGLSWGNALKTLTAVDAIIASDAVNTDNIFIKNGTITSSSQWSPKSQNYYFSCAGTETSASQRELEDKDGNGIVESWEFKYPTLLTCTLSSGYPINFIASSSVIIDGLIVSNTGSSIAASSPAYISVVKWVAGTAISPTTSTFQNSIIRNCDLTYGNNTYPYSRSNYGCLLNVSDNGVVKNCLIEKNKISITSTNLILVPVASLTLSSLFNSTPKVTNVVVRNNYATVTLASSVTQNDRVQGMIFSVGGGVTGFPSGEGVFTNCLVYNNEITFSYPTSITSNSASIAGNGYNMYGKGTFRNCLFANNKLTNLGSAMYCVRNGNYNYTVNNCAFWNNQNTVSGNTSGVSMGTSGNLYVGSSVTNNVMDVATTGTWGTAMTFANNLTDLAQTNTGSNAPYFSAPTTFTGSKGVIDENDPTDITQSRWILKDASYLNGKGSTYTGISTDLAGNTFASTPSSGAYEYFGYYRSNSNGNWSSASTWQSSKDNSTWSDNTLPPTSDVNSIVIQNGNTVTVAANATAPALTINGGGKLTLNNGFTLNAASLTIGSDNTNGTGTFTDANSSGALTVNGATNVNQTLNAAYARNWYLSSPVSTATVPESGYSFWKRDETTNNWTTLNSGDALTPGMGFIAKPTNAPSTYTFSGGQLNSGNIAVNLKYSVGVTKSGFNLIGNPYASHFTISKTMTDAANALNTIWYRTVSTYDESQSKYNYTFQTCVINQDGSYVGTPSGVTNIVAPMQSFWVKTSVNNSTLTFTNAMRIHQSSNPLKVKSQNNESMSILRLQVSNGKENDETVFYVNENASDSFDSYDALKMSNASASIPEIFSTCNDNVLAINGLSCFPLNAEIPIGFTTGELNKFSIKTSEISNIDNVVVLKDNLLNIETDISTGASYEFVSDATSTVNRFSVLFKSKEVITDLNYMQKKNFRNNVYLTNNRQIGVFCNEDLIPNSKVIVYTVTGQKITEQMITSSFTNITVPETGIYLIKIKMSEITENYKISIQ